MGGKTGTSTSTTTIPPQVLARYNSVNSQAQGVAATPFQQYSTNPNAFVAPVNQQQYAGIGGINQAANMAQPAFGAAEAGTFNATQQATPQGFQSGVSNYMNPFLNTAVQGTVNQLQNVNQQQQQGMLGNAISQGAFGGDRANIGLGNLMNQQNLALGQTVSGMENQGFQNAAQNYQTGINQQLAGSNQLGNLGAGAQQSALAGAQAQLGAGTMEQQTQQAGNTALYNQFQQQQAYPFQVAQFLANIAEGTGALSGTSTTSTQPMPFFSDRRLKENIKKVGKANNGLPIYTYNYKNDPTEQTHIGFMADEVEKKHPDAVGLAGGYKTVDYEKAARPAKFSGGALSSEGGLVVPQHAGMGFAEGGTPTEAPAMPAGLAHLIAMQNEMPVRGGGINQDVAASAQAIAPQNFVPPEAMSAPINYFSQITDPAASPAAAPQKHTTDTTGLMPNHNNQMFNLSNDPTASYSGYGNQNSPSEYGPGPGMGLAAGGRIGKEGGGSVYDMIAQQQAIYDQLLKGIPTSRNIATGAPSQQHQLLGANQPKPQQPQSGLQQLGGVSGLIGLGKEASQGYDWAKAHMPSSSTPAQADSSIAAAAPAAPIADIDPSLIDKNGFQPNLARGGVAGHYADGGTAQDDMPYKDPNDLDIPNENNNYKLNQEANPQGSSSGTSQTGLGIGQALQLANMAGSAMSGIGSALGLLALKSGGVAGRGHYADGGDPRPDAADINGPIDPDLSTGVTGSWNSGPIDQSSNDEDLSHFINRLLLGNAAGPVAPAESIVKGSQTDNTGMSDADLAWAAQHNKASAAPIDVKNYPVVAENGPVKGLASPVAPSNAVSTNNVKAAAPAPDTSQGLGSAKSWFDDAGNRNMALSILSGLGHMAGSNSRYLGSAILQGLGGGAETYANLQKQQADIAALAPVTAQRNVDAMNSLLAGHMQYNAQNPNNPIPLVNYAKMVGYKGDLSNIASDSANPMGALKGVASPNANYSYTPQEMQSLVIDHNGTKIPAANDPSYMAGYRNHYAPFAGNNPFARQQVEFANNVISNNSNYTTDVNGNKISIPGSIEAGQKVAYGTAQSALSNDYIQKGITFNDSAREAKGNLSDLESAYSQFKGGADVEARANMQRVLDAIDPNGLVPSLHDKTATNYDIAMKDAMSLINNKLSTMPGGAPKAELESIAKTVPQPNLTDSARHHLIERAKAILDYQSDMYNEYATKHAGNPNDPEYNVNTFQQQYQKRHPFVETINKATEETAPKPARTITRTGVVQSGVNAGKKAIQYSDGSVEIQ